jgi:hypothetical protein
VGAPPAQADGQPDGPQRRHRVGPPSKKGFDVFNFEKFRFMVGWLSCHVSGLLLNKAGLFIRLAVNFYFSEKSIY